MASWSFKAWIALRDYLNEGGKLVFRRSQRARAVPRHAAQPAVQQRRRPERYRPRTTTGPISSTGSSTRPTTPATTGARTPRSRSSSPSPTTSSSTTSGPPRGPRLGYGTPTLDAGRSARAGGLFDGMAPFTLDTSSGNDPNQDVNGIAQPRAKSPDPAADLVAASRRRSRCARSGSSSTSPVRRRRRPAACALDA